MQTQLYETLVDKHREEILAAEDYIWRHPETGFREWKTTAYMQDVFEKAGYTLVKAGDIPGFYTDIETGRPGPKLLIMAELDALSAPNHVQAVDGCAHACGHHAQCAAMAGIALALKEPGALDGLSGSVRLMCVPAEELIELDFRDGLRRAGVIHYLGGKTEFMHRGYMDGVDLAFLFHTSTRTDCDFDCHYGQNGCIAKTVRYEGVAAHAGGSPEKGVNALYAASLGLQGINAIRETLRDDDHIRIHPIMTAGGACVNIIPCEATLESYIRGASFDAILDANRKVDRALAAGALALGARVSVSDRPGYAPLVNSPELVEAAGEAMRALLGADRVKITNEWTTGCTDMGDVSCIMPVLHPHIAGAADLAEAFWQVRPEVDRLKRRDGVEPVRGKDQLVHAPLPYSAAAVRDGAAVDAPRRRDAHVRNINALDDALRAFFQERPDVCPAAAAAVEDLCVRRKQQEPQAPARQRAVADVHHADHELAAQPGRAAGIFQK